MQSFHVAIATVKCLRNWNFPPKIPPSTSSSGCKDLKIGWIRLEIQDFCWQSVQVESGEILNVVDAQSFHLSIAKVKYLRTWNFPPKCPPSISSSSGEDFENPWNTITDIGILLAQCTCGKWQNFKCFRCAKFSPYHCKCKIPAHLKLPTQMATLNIFELRQRFQKSFEYRGRYRIFDGTVYRLNVAKFHMLWMRKFSACHC